MFFDEALSNWREVLGGISKTNISIDINDLDDEMEEMFCFAAETNLVELVILYFRQEKLN